MTKEEKDALIAEMERLDALYHTSKDLGGDLFIQGLFCFIDNLEVKEVNLEEEICSFFSKNPIPYEHITDWPLLKNCAIHFFKLGLKAQKEEIE